MGIDLPQDPAIPFLGIYPKDASSYYRDNFSAIFIAARFIISKSWKQLRYLSTDEWIMKMWHICTKGNYSSIKTNEIRKFAVSGWN